MLTCIYIQQYTVQYDIRAMHAYTYHEIIIITRRIRNSVLYNNSIVLCSYAVAACSFFDSLIALPRCPCCFLGPLIKDYCVPR